MPKTTTAAKPTADDLLDAYRRLATVERVQGDRTGIVTSYSFHGTLDHLRAEARVVADERQAIAAVRSRIS